MPFVENLDFLNTNTLRNFPIREGLSKENTEGNFVIPDDFIVDLVLSATADPAKRFYISRLVNLPSLITVEVSDYTGLICGEFIINPAEHTVNQVYYLQPNASNYAGANGKLVVSVLTSLENLPYGNFSFVKENTEFEARTIIPSLSNISRFVFVNTDGTSFSATGNVIIQARTNVKFRRINDTTVAIDAGEGLGLNEPCDQELPYIKSINGISPDTAGNFVITTSNCSKLTAITNGLNWSDTCCKPCLGCDEIGELTARLMQIETDLIELKTHYQQVNSMTTQFGTIINASCSC